MMKLLKDKNILVKLTALTEIINLLNSIDIENNILPKGDYNFFDYYIFPNILDLFDEENSALILLLTDLLGKIVQLENKFLELDMISRNENNKHEEIFFNFDVNLYEFKQKLLKKLGDLIYNHNNDTDIQINIIRKMPELMAFFGKRDAKQFIIFLIDLFNKKDWNIQSEILKKLPEISHFICDQSLIEFLVVCIEAILYKNLNEIKIYEMIKAITILLQNDFLDTKKGVEMFNQIIPLILHPNIWIRDEFIEFANVLFSKITQSEIYTFIREIIKPYLKVNNNFNTSIDSSFDN